MISARTESNYIIEIPPIFNGYEVIKQQGIGSTSVVYKVRKKSWNKLVIAKIISKTDMINKHWIDDVNNEITIHKMINHPNIVKIHDTFEITNSKNETYIVIIEEYCSKGSLSSFINKYGLKSKYVRKNIEKGLLESVRYLHGLGYAHCDINAENILIDKNINVKLNDLGCSQYCQSDNSVFFKNDIWSIGSIFYTLYEGKPLSNKIYVNGLLRVRIEDKKLKKLVEDSTLLNAVKRPTINELINYEYNTTQKEDVEKDEQVFDVVFEEEKEDPLSNTIFNNCYFDYSIDYGSLNDLKLSKSYKKNNKKSKKKNNSKKHENNAKSKSQYFAEKEIFLLAQA